MEHIDILNSSLATLGAEICRFVIRTTDLKNPVLLMISNENLFQVTWMKGFLLSLMGSGCRTAKGRPWLSFKTTLRLKLRFSRWSQSSSFCLMSQLCQWFHRLDCSSTDLWQMSSGWADKSDSGSICVASEKKYYLERRKRHKKAKWRKNKRVIKNRKYKEKKRELAHIS